MKNFISFKKQRIIDKYIILIKVHYMNCSNKRFASLRGKLVLGYNYGDLLSGGGYSGLFGGGGHSGLLDRDDKVIYNLYNGGIRG